MKTDTKGERSSIVIIPSTIDNQIDKTRVVGEQSYTPHKIYIIEEQN